MTSNVNQQELRSKSIRFRIVGGSLVNKGEAPWMASVLYRNNLACGGSIVSKMAILTAAHCSHNRQTHFFTIRVGSIYYQKGGSVKEVSRILQHPQFSWSHKNNDIAIIYLKQQIEFELGVIAAIELPTCLQTLKIGSLVSVFGWGSTKENSITSSQLRTIDVPIVSESDCIKSYKGIFIDSVFCAGYFKGQKDACDGDSEGPLVLGQILVGIVSFGDGCARQGRYGVNTKVQLFTDWIRQSILE